MSKHTQCVTKTLIENQHCKVVNCEECNVFHLHIGPVSVCLPEDVFMNICNALGDFNTQKDFSGNTTLPVNYIPH